MKYDILLKLLQLVKEEYGYDYIEKIDGYGNTADFTLLNPDNHEISVRVTYTAATERGGE